MPQTHNFPTQEQFMEDFQMRRSDRVSLSVPIWVNGVGDDGVALAERTKTVALSRHGGTIVLKHAVSPGSPVTICHIESGRATQCRVVAELGGQEDGHVYGIVMLDREIDLWGIEFPPPARAENAAARVLLECIVCRNFGVAYLDEMEAEVFASSRYISRPCINCQHTTVWRDCHSIGGGHHHLPASGHRTTNDRLRPRVQTKIAVCIRQRGLGDEVVVTENLSRGGFSFKSPTYYYAGSIVHAAVPYSPASGNIFVPARIIHARLIPSEGVNQHGLAHIQIA
jgi:PilZ domain-containing protein